MLALLLALEAQAPAPDVVQDVERLVERLEFARVERLAEQALRRTDLSSEQRLVLLGALGTAQVVTGDLPRAEQAFRLALRERLSFELGPDTSPKILAVFRKVQREELELAASLEASERRKLLATIALEPRLASPVAGGRPLKLAVDVRDPHGVVRSLRLSHRVAGGGEFATLPLLRAPTGGWDVVLPGSLTASEQGLTLEYFVEAFDGKGLLASAGTDSAALALSIPAGREQPPKPLAPRVLVGSLIGVGVAAVATLGVGLGLFLTQSEFSRSALNGADGGVLAVLEGRGRAFAVAVNVGFVVDAVVALGSVVVAFFTDFDA